MDGMKFKNRTDALREYQNWFISVDAVAIDTTISTVILVLVILIGGIGNLLVILVFWNQRQKRTSMLLILVLAICDFVGCLTVIPTQLLMNYYLFDSDIICKLTMYTAHLNTTISGSTLLLIAIDRYTVVCRPTKPKLTHRDISKAVIIYSIIWAIANIPETFTDGAYNLLSFYTEVYHTKNNFTMNSSTFFPEVILNSSNQDNVTISYNLYGNRNQSYHIKNHEMEKRDPGHHDNQMISEYVYTGDCRSGIDVRFLGKNGRALIQGINFSIFVLWVIILSILYGQVFWSSKKRRRSTRSRRRAPHVLIQEMSLSRAETVANNNSLNGLNENRINGVNLNGTNGVINGNSILSPTRNLHKAHSEISMSTNCETQMTEMSTLTNSMPPSPLPQKAIHANTNTPPASPNLNGIRSFKNNRPSMGRVGSQSSERSQIYCTQPCMPHIRTAQLLIVVTLCFIGTWLPFFLVRMNTVPSNKPMEQSPLTSFAINPVIYSIGYADFREKAYKLLCFICSRRNMRR